MLWHPKTLQNLAMYNVFSFWAVFPLPESYQNDPKFNFNTLLRSDTQKSSKKCRKHHRILISVRNRFWGLVSVRNRFLAPPPAKADIATAILTNVIEHLVLLLPPNKHAFTAQSGVGGFIIWNENIVQLDQRMFPVHPFPMGKVDGWGVMGPPQIQQIDWSNLSL